MRRVGNGALASIAVTVAALGLVGWGLWSRGSALAALKSTAEDEAVPRVELISPSRGPATRSLDLPGNVNAWYEAPIYAQVAGYVSSWNKDFGATVRKGDVLATIDAPALDEQLGSAQANLKVADARARLARVTARRWTALSGTQAVAQQEVDVQVADAEAQDAQVQASQHEVARYQALESFKRIVAPFDGVVTSRRTDLGAFVNAAGGDAGSPGAASELFTVADIHRLRVFVSVPEDYAALLRPGLTATLKLPQFPNRSFEAQYETTAEAFNPQSRSVTTELTVDNRDHAIWPGTFANVHFSVPGDPDLLIVPEQSLLFRAEGMQVALVDAQNRVHLQNVTLGLNLGRTVQVVSGLNASDRLVNDPSAGLLEGETVQVTQPAKGYDAQSQAGGKAAPADAPSEQDSADTARQPGPAATSAPAKGDTETEGDPR